MYHTFYEIHFIWFSWAKVCRLKLVHSLFENTLTSFGNIQCSNALRCAPKINYWNESAKFGGKIHLKFELLIISERIWNVLEWREISLLCNGKNFLSSRNDELTCRLWESLSSLKKWKCFYRLGRDGLFFSIWMGGSDFDLGRAHWHGCCPSDLDFWCWFARPSVC